MIYGYIRVSTDKQTVENQRFELERFCSSNGLQIDRWIEETVSGTVPWGRRALGRCLRRARTGDLLLCAELSRLGRSLLMILDVLNYCLGHGIRVWTVKDGYRLGDDIVSKVIAFAFGLSAEIERSLISQRTREALARRRAAGLPLGRPRGCTPTPKCARFERAIRRHLALGHSRSHICRCLRIDPSTLRRYLKSGNGPSPLPPPDAPSRSATESTPS